MDLAVTALRVVASLAAVVGLVWLLGRAARRRGTRSGLDTSRFAVVGRHSLGRSSGVTVLRVGDEALVLGVTEQSVQLLARTALTTVSDPIHLRHLPAPREARGDDRDAGESGADGSPAGGRTWGRRVISSSAGSARSAGSAGSAGSTSVLAGSALSPATWSQALDLIRERTTRR